MPGETKTNRNGLYTVGTAADTLRSRVGSFLLKLPMEFPGIEYVNGWKR